MATSRGTTISIRRIENYILLIVVELLAAKKKKRAKQKGGGGERRKKKTEKEMKTKPLDRIVFRANVQYLDG